MGSVASTTNPTAARPFRGLAANGFEGGCLWRGPQNEGKHERKCLRMQQMSHGHGHCSPAGGGS